MKPAWACSVTFLLATVLQGQEPTPPSSLQGTTATDQSQLPDAPGASTVVAKTSSSSSNFSDTEQTKRILGFIPNFRSVGADVILPPQTAKDKFKVGLQDTFDYSNFIFVGAQAGLSQATNSYPTFHQGARG
jgi:hypothetical protein